MKKIAVLFSGLVSIYTGGVCAKEDFLCEIEDKKPQIKSMVRTYHFEEEQKTYIEISSKLSAFNPDAYVEVKSQYFMYGDAEFVDTSPVKKSTLWCGKTAHHAMPHMYNTLKLSISVYGAPDFVPCRYNQGDLTVFKIIPLRKSEDWSNKTNQICNMLRGGFFYNAMP